MANKSNTVGGSRRSGDTVVISGDYQARAIREGFVVQRFWHSQKLELIRWVCPPNTSSSVLDVGCGSGVVSNFLALKAASVDAVDANPAAIEYAREHAAAGNMRFHLGLVDEMRFEPGSFDRIYCLELIEHLHYQQIVAVLRQLGKLLRPEGRLLLTTPNYASGWPVIERAMDLLHLTPRMKDQQHVSRLTEGRLAGLLHRSSLRIVRPGRYCGIAPFVSVLSWHLAEAVASMERHLGEPFGNLLYAVAVRQDGSLAAEMEAGP